MKLLLALVIVVAVVAIWAAYGREWLKAQPWEWSTRYFAWIEPIEIRLWKKSETILWSRFLQGLGILLSALASLGTIDLTPLTPLFPAKLAWLPPLLPLVITLSGILSERLRNTSTKPLELVAVPDIPTPEIAVHMEKAQAAQAEAVIVVQAAKSEPAVTEPPKKDG